jgi:uncharacterized protein (DUF305 family)
MKIIPLQKAGVATVCVIAVLSLAPMAQACEGGNGTTKCSAMPMSHDMSMGKPTGLYAPAIEKMHMDMGLAAVTGDADVDFVNGMIPHHQGAIDMAKILKEKGKDPMLQKMADEIIKAQESEIAVMKKWLADYAAKAK